MYLKRRKILFEDSMVPPLSPETEEDKRSLPPPPLIEYSIHTERLAEQLRSETKPEKLEFFFQLGLTPITLVKKEGIFYTTLYLKGPGRFKMTKIYICYYFYNYV